MSIEQRKQIQELLEDNRLFLMLKGTPQRPRCGFSSRVVRILDQYKKPYTYFNVFENPDLMNLIKEYTDWPTTPQLFINGDLIGGCDIVEQLHTEEKLEVILSGA